MRVTSRGSCQQFAQIFIEFGVLLGELFHQIGQAVGDGVQLVLYGVVGSLLCVLQQGHQEERDDSGDGVDDQLPGVDGAEKEERRRPEHHYHHAHYEEPCLRGACTDVGREPIEDGDVRRNFGWENCRGLQR